MLSRSALASTRSAASLVSRRAYAIPNNITNGGSLGPNGPEKPRQPDINTIEEKTNPLYVSTSRAGGGGARALVMRVIEIELASSPSFHPLPVVRLERPSLSSPPLVLE